MNVGIYSPYLHILGGGERYILSIAESLSKQHTVDLFAPVETIRKSQEVFHIPLTSVHCIPVKKRFTFSLYDAFFFMTDGSVFYPISQKNYLIIQSPEHIPHASFWQSIKLRKWNIICYSSFMQEIIRKRIQKDACILSPAIDDIFFHHAEKKEKIILSVGRFFSHLHNKHHDVLIETFKEHSQTHFKGWKLIIAGRVTDKNGQRLVEELRLLGKGYAVEIQSDVGFSDLVSLYRKAGIYWHAAGFGEDLDTHPEKAEHFGITTLEAMASRCVPVVFNGGGQKDIITDGKDGLLWNTKEELLDKTMDVISNEKRRLQLVKHAAARVEDFSTKRFEEKLYEIVSQ